MKGPFFQPCWIWELNRHNHIYIIKYLTPPTPRNISARNFWLIYGRIRQWKILALSVLHQREVVDVVQAGSSAHLIFFSPQALLVKLLRGRCKTMVFYALEATHPQKFHCSSRVPFPSIFKDQGAGVWQRSCTVCFLIYVYPINISRLKCGIRRTFPLLEAQKTGGKWYISCGQVKFLRHFLPYPTQIFQG